MTIDDDKLTHRRAFGRRALLGGIAGAGASLVVRSLATGIPARVLLDPLAASAQDSPRGRMLILSTSQQGDPVNANVPGTYGLPELFHPPQATMAETAMTIRGTATSAARPWAQLPQSVLDKTMFFHHATYTPVHGELNRVQKMMGATEKNDMLVSLFARELAPLLGTVQSDPVSLGARGGGELLASAGRTLGNVAPLSVRRALGGADGALGNLTALRDDSVDRVHALFKEHGTPSQRTLLDSWARSRDEVRNVETSLVERLDGVGDNGEAGQILAASVLAAMNITPVITINLDFGRDNHADGQLEREATSHVTALAAVEQLMAEIATLKASGVLRHDVLVGSLNVFGRTLKKKGITGRDHNAGHHAMVLMGDGVRGGIVGGVELNDSGREYVAQSINSTSGAGGDGDIPFEETLGAMGKTVGAIMGIERTRLDEMLTTGKVVESAIDS